MKSFFTLLAITFVTFINVSFAQSLRINSVKGVHKANSSEFVKENKNNLSSVGLKTTVLSPPFFTEDFSSGIPASWTNIDNAGTGVVWVVTTTGAYNTGAVVDGQLNPVGTTATNGYLKLDSDSAGQGLNEDASVITSAINCSSHAAVYLKFNEYFAQYGTSSGIVSVSNNNTTWTDFYHAETGLMQDSATSNPHAVDLDISSVAANQATVYLKFRYQGNWDYWWFVDDVQLFEPNSIDLMAYSISKLSNEYTSVPLAQASGLTLSSIVKNVGLTTITGGTALFEVVNINTSGVVFSQTISLASISPGSTKVVNPTNTLVIPAAGTYASRVTVTAAGDGDLSNNVIQSSSLSISDSVYSRDDGNYFVAQGVGAGPGEDGAAGQNFNVTSTDWLTSITFFMADTFSFSAPGTPVFFTIHNQVNDTTPPDGSIILASTDTLLFTPGSVPLGGAYYTLPIKNGGIQLNAGLYFVAFHEVDLILPMGSSNAIFTPGAVWVHFNSIPSPPAINGWAKAEDFGFQLAYMIRANFGNGPSGINNTNVNTGVSVYPNPSLGKFSILLNDNSNQYAIQVVNTLGEIVYTNTFVNTNRINLDLSYLSVGMYSLNIVSKNNFISKKIIINNN